MVEKHICEKKIVLSLAITSSAEDIISNLLWKKSKTKINFCFYLYSLFFSTFRANNSLKKTYCFYPKTARCIASWY